MYGLSVTPSVEAMNGHKPPVEPLALVRTKPAAARRSRRLNAMKLTAIAALLLVLPALDVIA
jgi:hypothetical protein